MSSWLPFTKVVGAYTQKLPPDSNSMTEFPPLTNSNGSKPRVKPSGSEMNRNMASNSLFGIIDDDDLGEESVKVVEGNLINKNTVKWTI